MGALTILISMFPKLPKLDSNWLIPVLPVFCYCPPPIMLEKIFPKLGNPGGKNGGICGC